MGHLISFQGVRTDLQRIEAMVKWPQPTTLKALRGFLGLTRYYCKFIRHYGQTSKPLTDLLKKNVFGWNQEVANAFQNSKKAKVPTPVLRLPDFPKACHDGN